MLVNLYRVVSFVLIRSLWDRQIISILQIKSQRLSNIVRVIKYKEISFVSLPKCAPLSDLIFLMIFFQTSM